VLSPGETEEIKKSLEHESDPGELMNRTSQLLSAHSNSIGIVLSPPISQLVMQHVEFIKLSRYRVLVVLVGKADLVQHRWIQLEEVFSQAELDQAGRYLVENFRGKNLTEIRWELLKLMRKEKALYDRLLKTVTLLGSAAVVNAEEESSEDSQIYLGGTARVIGRLGFAEVDRLVSLLQTFEEKSRLVKIITACLKSQDKSPAVTVGLEDHIPGMGNWSLITSPYSLDNSTVGSLGILGPSRMEYEKAISLVDYVARLFGEILRSNLNQDAGC
jgi:heat-inducible transcriptional repressor